MAVWHAKHEREARSSPSWELGRWIWIGVAHDRKGLNYKTVGKVAQRRAWWSLIEKASRAGNVKSGTHLRQSAVQSAPSIHPLRRNWRPSPGHCTSSWSAARPRCKLFPCRSRLPEWGQAIKLKFWVNKLKDDSHSLSQSALGSNDSYSHSLADMAFTWLGSFTHYFIYIFITFSTLKAIVLKDLQRLPLKHLLYLYIIFVLIKHTLNSPPLPSSNSRTYPSTKEWFGGCHATVTELFSAEQSDGSIVGVMGAVGRTKKVIFRWEMGKRWIKDPNKC